MTDTRLLIISGKGGVGKTTVAAATAVGAASRGYRTLVVSLDRAHSLGDVLQMTVDSAPTPVSPPAQSSWHFSGSTSLPTPAPSDGSQRDDITFKLDAMEIDPQSELRRDWGTLQDYLQRFLRYLGADGVTADELAIFPGLEELLVLTRLSDMVASEDYDFIVADMAPTASSLRYLSFPDMMDGMLGSLVKWDKRFASLLRPLQGKVVQMPVPETTVYTSLQDLSERLSNLRDLLLDNRRTAVRLVMIPETIVLEETRRALTYLHLFGLNVDGIVVNRVLPKAALTGYFAAWGDIQAKILKASQESFSDFPLLLLPFREREVLGIDSLMHTCDTLYEQRDPTHFSNVNRPFEYRQDEDGTKLILHLRNVTDTNLDLRRREGNLILTVGGWRRIITLPDSLSDADIGKARLSKSTLTIHFQPKT